MLLTDDTGIYGNIDLAECRLQRNLLPVAVATGYLKRSISLTIAHIFESVIFACYIKRDC